VKNHIKKEEGVLREYLGDAEDERSKVEYGFWNK